MQRRGSGPRGRPRRRPRARRRAPALGRAPSGASRERFLRLALRGGGRLRHRRLRRLRQHLVGHRPRGIARRARSRLLPALARPLLPRDHPAPGVHVLRRRVQGDGPRALRRARLRRRALARPAPPAGGRLRARPLLLSPRVGRRPHDLGRRGAGHRPASSRRSSRICWARRGDPAEPLTARHEAIAASLQVGLRARPSSTCSAGSTRGRGSRGSAWRAAAP